MPHKKHHEVDPSTEEAPVQAPVEPVVVDDNDEDQVPTMPETEDPSTEESGDLPEYGD